MQKLRTIVSSLLILISVILVLTACGPKAPTATVSAPTLPPTKAPVAKGRCGDGVCDGPETPDICPADCPADEAAGTSTGPFGEYDTYRVTNPTSGVELFVAVIYPQDWNGETLPALVVIPGGTDYSKAITDRPMGRKFADAGFVVAAFDPDGRGQSVGEEDYNGFVHQDGLAAVVEFAASLPGVDSEQIGMISMSYGVTLASGVLARYPDLPVRFLIDWEGPADRNDTGGCGGDDIGKLNPLIACDDEAYWAGHEALTFISQIKVPYQRIQSEVDHVQPDVTHALKMVNAAVEGGVPWVRLNDLPPNQTYNLDAPPAMIPEGAGRQSEKLILRYAQELFSLTATTDTNAPQFEAFEDGRPGVVFPDMAWSPLMWGFQNLNYPKLAQKGLPNPVPGLESRWEIAGFGNPARAGGTIIFLEKLVYFPGGTRPQSPGRRPYLRPVETGRV